VRIADLSLTHRIHPLRSSFGDDLQDGLESLNVPFEPGAVLTGRGGRRIALDFLVHGARQSAILSMTARNTSRAHDVATDTFTKWFDLEQHQTDLQRITVVDSNRIQQFKPDDLSRIEMYASVIPYPEEGDRLRELLVA
jgi:hypothetical protein